MFSGPFAIFKKLADNVYYSESMQTSLTDEQLQNLKELEDRFNGSVNIVVSDAAESVGPFTIPAVSEILTTNKLLKVLEAKDVEVGLDSKFTQIRFTFQRFYDFFKEGVTITKTGDSFNIETSFNEPITLYVPTWFLDNNPTLEGQAGVAQIDITDDSRIGVVLHEIGHWTNNSMFFDSISFIIRILGFLLFIFSSIKFFQTKSSGNNLNFIQKIKTFSVQKVNDIKTSSFYAITALIGFILYRMSAITNIFSTFNETNADNVAKNLGYGQAASDYIIAIMTKVNGDSYSGPLNNSLKNFEVLFKEFFTRLTSNYPSLEWRTGNLLGLLESDTNFELFIENELGETSKLSNIIISMLSKFDKLVKGLPPLNSGNIRSISNNNRIRNNINENIDLLINECK